MNALALSAPVPLHIPRPVPRPIPCSHLNPLNLGSSLFATYRSQVPREAGTRPQRAVNAEPRACPYLRVTGASEGLLAEEDSPGAFAEVALGAALALALVGLGGIWGKLCLALGTSRFTSYMDLPPCHRSLPPCGISQGAPGLSTPTS